jgi:hypothetical protein
MSTCIDGSDGEFVVFCPLWRDQALKGLCGGTFEFGKSRTRRQKRRVHVTGVLFEGKQVLRV